jgi:hypothetical protein
MCFIRWKERNAPPGLPLLLFSTASIRIRIALGIRAPKGHKNTRSSVPSYSIVPKSLRSMILRAVYYIRNIAANRLSLICILWIFVLCILFYILYKQNPSFEHRASQNHRTCDFQKPLVQIGDFLSIFSPYTIVRNRAKNIITACLIMALTSNRGMLLP